MKTGQFLNKRYRYRDDYIPYDLTQSQKEARKLFLTEIHKKHGYTAVIKCPYCHNGIFTNVSEIDKRGLPSDIVICDSCDGCFKSNLLNPEANGHYYENISYLLRGKEVTDDAVEKLFWDRVRLFSYPRYRFISYFLKLESDRDLILELGCNDGANLFPWRKNGFSVVGIDLDPRMVRFGQRKGLNLIRGDLSKYDFSVKKPKIVILSHVLEHVMDIDDILNKLYIILQPDATLFIEVPGIRVHGIGDPLRYFDIEHNYNFDLNSLTRVLNSHLFKIIYADEYIRLLCTPNQDAPIAIGGALPMSLDRVKARLIKALINRFDFGRKKLRYLLRNGKTNSLVRKIFGKLQILYFKYHYASIINARKGNANAPY